MERNEASFEFFQAIQLVQTLTTPMADVRTGTDQLATAGDRLQQIIRIPIVGWLRVVVHRDFYAVLLSQFFYEVPVV